MTPYPQSGIPGPGPGYGQYPASGYGQPPAPPSERPRPLVIAVWLMYVMAVVELVYLVAEGQWLGSWMSSFFAAIETADASGSGTQVPASEIKDLVLAAMIVGGIVGALIWLWLAWKNRTGRNWARIVATVFFALSCLGLPELLTDGRLSTIPSTIPAADGTTIAVPPFAMPAWVIAGGVVDWLLVLAIIILLWQRAASRYYDAVSLSRRRPVYAPYAPPGYGAPGYAPPGYAPPGYAPPGSTQWQSYGQQPADPQDPQAPPRPPQALRRAELDLALNVKVSYGSLRGPHALHLRSFAEPILNVGCLLTAVSARFSDVWPGDAFRWLRALP